MQEPSVQVEAPLTTPFPTTQAQCLGEGKLWHPMTAKFWDIEAQVKDRETPR